MDKKKLLERVKESKALAESVAKDCAAYCADESISVAERWEVFSVAPEKEEGGWVDEPPESIIGFECTPYDDFYMERHSTFDVVGKLDEWAEETAKAAKGKKIHDEFVERLTPEIVDKLKNYYMVQYKGSWIYDW